MLQFMTMIPSEEAPHAADPIPEEGVRRSRSSFNREVYSCEKDELVDQEIISGVQEDLNEFE